MRLIIGYIVFVANRASVVKLVCFVDDRWVVDAWLAVDALGLFNNRFWFYDCFLDWQMGL